MEGALASVERSLRTVKVTGKEAGGCARSVPKHLGDRAWSPEPAPHNPGAKPLPATLPDPRQSPPTCGAYLNRRPSVRLDFVAVIRADTRALGR
jgi:hypothetical protein